MHNPSHSKKKPSADHSEKTHREDQQRNWEMGLLLVFYPEDNSNKNPIANKLLSSSSSSSLRRRSNSNSILTRAQSTISICALLLFLTLLLFTLSTFEPTIPTPTPKSQFPTSRRFLSDKLPTIMPKTKMKIKTNHNSLFPSSWFTNNFRNRVKDSAKNTIASSSIALQGMGTLYRRGTRAMGDLVVGHVLGDVSEAEFRLFLRLLQRSGLTAKGDVVFIFDSQQSSSKFASLIREESDSFLKLVHYYTKQSKNSKGQESSFDVTQFLKFGKKEKEMGQPLWGKRSRSNNGNHTDGGEEEDESTRVSYGSIVSFEATELDPENSLSGFLETVPLSLRRWACYPMLLGRVRRNFKHVVLLDVKNLLVLGNPLSRVRSQTPESVYLFTKSQSKHSKKNSERTRSRYPVNSAIIMGGMRGVRRLSNAMLTEVARVSMQPKKGKNPAPESESGLLSQLVESEFVLKNINPIKSTDSVSEASSLAGSKSKLDFSDHTVISNSAEVKSVIMRQICSFEADSSVYRDC